MNKIYLDPHPLEYKDDRIIISATLSGAKIPEKQIWFQVPAALEGALTNTCDSFVLAVLHVAMLNAAELHVHGPVSQSLVRNLMSFQEVWSMWRPDLYTPIEIRTSEEYIPEFIDSKQPAKSLLGFSGGVDSSFTAFRHARGLALNSSYKLAAGVMVHGFDIPLREKDMFEGALQRSRKLLESLELDLIPVATNLRDLGTDWTDIFGIAVASCLMLFQGHYQAGLIAQGVPFSCIKAFDTGSNPLTDPLLGSAQFQIIPDGAAFERMDKIMAMAEWRELRKYLRVCWKGEQKDRNCCRCEKCIRNILTFRILGLGLPECFEEDAKDRLVGNLNGLKEITIAVGYSPILKLADQKRIRDPWVKALEKSIHRSRLIRRNPMYADFHYYRGRLLRMLGL